MFDGPPDLASHADEHLSRYADTGLGLADASLVALADRLGAIESATLDERHFRVVRPLSGATAFQILPADA